MTGLMIFLIINLTILIGYINFNTKFNINQLENEKARTITYFYEFAKRYYEGFISLGVVLPDPTTVGDLKQAGLLQDSFPDYVNFKAKTIKNPCNDKAFDIIYFVNTSIAYDFRDQLNKLDWSFADVKQDLCNPSYPGIKIDYAVNGITQIYNYNVQEPYNGTVVILSAPSQIGYWVFSFSYRDYLMHYYWYEKGYTDIRITPDYFNLLQIANYSFSTNCPTLGIQLNNDYLYYYGGNQLSYTNGFFVPSVYFCIPILKGDMKSLSSFGYQETKYRNYQFEKNNHNLPPLTNTRNNFVYPTNRALNLVIFPVVLKTYSLSIKSSVTNKYYVLSAGYIITQCGKYNSTRTENGITYPVFDFLTQAPYYQKAHQSLYFLASVINENQTKTLQVTDNLFPSNLSFAQPETFNHRFQISKDKIIWQAGYYDANCNKKYVNATLLPVKTF